MLVDLLDWLRMASRVIIMNGVSEVLKEEVFEGEGGKLNFLTVLKLSSYFENILKIYLLLNLEVFPEESRNCSTKKNLYVPIVINYLWLERFKGKLTAQCLKKLWEKLSQGFGNLGNNFKVKGDDYASMLTETHHQHSFHSFNFSTA